MPAYVTSVASRHLAQRLVVMVAVVVGVSACGKLSLGSGDEMSWARAALQRNTDLEIVAADTQAGTFTLRVKDTGELRVVRAEEIVGGLPRESSGTAGGSRADVASAAQVAPASPAGGSASSLAEAPRATVSSVPAAPAGANAPATPAAPVAQSESAPRTEHEPDTAAAADAPRPDLDVAAITPGGRVLEAGPGYAIKAATAASPAARRERERSVTTSAAIEVRHDPIVCQGSRLLHIDNRNLAFDGDAVAAEDGCELHITNSHITAKGVGVAARAANVHIDNSQIEGDAASIDASDGAQVYASSTRFRGMSRRQDSASFHDLGGNVWN